MKALILAAGEGTRLRPLTESCPKPMLPVNGRPLLAYTIDWLRDNGIEDIAVNLHYLPQAISDYFGDGSRCGVRLTYSYEQELLGTAGAVKRLQPFFDCTFAVVYGDVLTDLDLLALYGYHRHCGGLATLALHRVEDASAKGLVDIDDEHRVHRFVEKPPPGTLFTNLVNAGVYMCAPAIVDYIPPGTACDFGRDVFPELLARGETLHGYPIPDDTYLLDIGSPDDYVAAQQSWPAWCRQKGRQAANRSL